MFSTAEIVYISSSLCRSRGQLWNVDKGLYGLHKLFETFVFSLLTGSRREAIFSQGVAKKGMYLSGIRYVPVWFDM